MDPNPRKRESDGTAAEEERRTRRRGEEEPTDEEVEEFFAIMRRIWEATRHLGGARAGAADHGVARPRGRGDGGAPRWQPAFVPEDFEHPGTAVISGDRRERSEKDEGAGKWRTMRSGKGRCFDLNEEPADA